MEPAAHRISRGEWREFDEIGGVRADWQLHEDSRQRYASIMAKQAQLKELEGSVSDGVIELEQVSFQI